MSNRIFIKAYKDKNIPVEKMEPDITKDFYNYEECLEWINENQNKYWNIGVYKEECLLDLI